MNVKNQNHQSGKIFMFSLTFWSFSVEDRQFYRLPAKSNVPISVGTDFLPIFAFKSTKLRASTAELIQVLKFR